MRSFELDTGLLRWHVKAKVLLVNYTECKRFIKLAPELMNKTILGYQYFVKRYIYMLQVVALSLLCSN